MRRLVFELSKILSLNHLIGLICEVLNDQNLFTELNLADWFSSYVRLVHVVISQNELKLLSSVEKLITLNVCVHDKIKQQIRAFGN